MSTLGKKFGQELRDRYDDTDMWLGSLFYWEIPTNFNVSIQDWMEGIKDTVIEDLYPASPRNVDAFRRAVSSVRGKQVRIGDNVWQFMPRSAGHDEENVFKNITIEELDGAGHRLSYETGVEFVYNRHAKQIIDTNINSEVYDSVPVEVLDEIDLRVARVHEYFNSHGGHIGAVKMRDLIRRDVERNMIGVGFKRGLYFVYPQFTERLEAIEELLLSFGEVDCGIIPLIDDDKRREMLRKSFEEESMARCRNLMAKMKDLLDSDKKVSIGKATSMHKEYLELQSRLASYSDLLNATMEETGTALRALQVQSLALFKRVNR